MNIKQQEKKAEEIRKWICADQQRSGRDQTSGHGNWQDHDRIARELENSKQDEKELESFIEAKQSELDEWKEGRRKSPGS